MVMPMRFLGILAVCFAASSPALAEHTTAHTTSPACNPATIFKSLTSTNFIAAIQACEAADIAAAIAVAQAAPTDDVALSCLLPLQAIAASGQSGGLLTAFESFRRAKMSGFVSACTAWATSIPLLP